MDTLISNFNEGISGINKNDIKDLIMMSLLESYCSKNFIDCDKVMNHFYKVNLISINKNNYTSYIKNRVLSVIDSLGHIETDSEEMPIVQLTTDYTDVEYLGEGAMGTVFSGHNVIDNNKYAIKKIEIMSPKDIKEVQYMSKLYHPNIVRYHTTWIHKSDLFIQMELCDFTLKEYMSKIRTKKHRAEIMYDICKGLEYIHSKGIIHRDIKPTNILIKNNTAKIADFSLSTLVDNTPNVKLLCYDDFDDNSDIMTLNIGTELYSSPEQLNGINYSFPTDIYSLGIIYFEMTIGENNRMKRIDAIMDLRNNKFDWSRYNILKEDIKIIKRLTNVDPLKRPTIKELIAYLYTRYKHIKCQP